MEYSVIPKPTHPRQIAPLQRPNLRDLRHIAPLCATYCPYDILPPFWQKGAICRRDNMSGGQYVMEPGRMMKVPFVDRIKIFWIDRVDIEI